eukprot:PITA_08877
MRSPDFDILGELQNLYIKIPFLQAIQDIPIYAKTIKELCIKKSRRNANTNPRVQVVGTLSDLLSGKEAPIKYEDPKNPIVTVQIYGQTLTNALVDLGAAINILTTSTCQKLGIMSVEPTSTLLELVDRSLVRPEGTLYDVMVSVDSWEYPIDFLVINPKTRLDGHPLILGRPWLATADAYIGCRQGNMTITKGSDVKNLILYPPAQPSLPMIKTNPYPVSYLTNNIRSPLTIHKALDFKDQTEDDAINNFINQTEVRTHMQCSMIETAFEGDLEEDPLKDPHDQTIPVTIMANSKVVEIEPGKTLNINANLTVDQETKLVKVLQKYKNAFAWDYPDMKGIDPQLCTHHIYIEKDARPVRQPQRRLNPHLKEIVKDELQKLLDVNFIYPISDSKWVSPLVVVPKKNGKWRICVDYRELNKATQKDHFPLPFIDQVLDTLAGKKFFSFLDGFSGYNQIQIAPEDQDKTTFTCPWGTFAYRVLPFGLCNAPATFQRAILSIFADLINDGLEVYMDDFTPYGDEFDPALDTLEKVLQRCIATRLCLSHEKCYMMMTEGLILGHFISAAGIQVDPAKIQILLLIPIPTTQTEEFDITIKDRPGKENPVADFLSRIPKSVETEAVEDQFPDEHLFAIAVRTPWYADVANYLAVGKLPRHLTPQERKQIVQRSIRFSWIGDYLFHTGADMQIRRCIREDEILDILKACHNGPCGGHFTDKRTTHKVLQAGYYWPTIFKDAKKFVQACDSCQRAGKPSQADEMPLRPQVVIEPFERWALDFVGPINPTSNQRTYILVATDYVTKWVEAKSLARATEDSVIQFLFHLFVRYGLPREIITDGGPQFVGNKLAATLNNYHIQHKITTPYHPQANGQVENSNKIIESILTKTIASHRRDWAARLLEALWAYRTTWRSTTGYSPYQMVFGKQPIFPIEFEIQTLRTAQEVGLDLNEAQINRLRQINELDEIRLSALQNTTLIQQQRAKWHDALIKKKVFHEGDWALLYDSRFQDFPGKLQTRWLGPYEIQKVHDNGNLTLTTIDGSGHTFKVNGHRVRLYRRPLTRESFLQQLQQDTNLEILGGEAKSSSPVT